MGYSIEFEPEALEDWYKLQQQPRLRLIYVVIDSEKVVYVVAVGKLEDFAAYRTASTKLD